MASSKMTSRAGCCSIEKQRLMEELRKCDFCATSYKEHHRCYRNAARDSGKRTKTCMLG